MAKKNIPDPEEIKKLYLVLELPQKEIEPIIEKIKKHIRYKYYWTYPN